MSFKYTYAGKTDIGLVRSGNEDSFKIVEENNLFIVCDGMGGHQAGEVASKEACEILSYSFSQLAEEISGDGALAIPADFPRMGDILVKSIRIANRSIYSKAIANAELSGMGTTIVAAVLEDNLINIAHAGDSRVYRLTEDNLIPLTTDHSWVAELHKTGMYTEAEVGQMAGKNVITRALGVHETVEIDFRADKISPVEIYIFCTDGLCGFIPDEEIYAVARECQGNVQKICDDLVEMANQRGGQDNVTIVAFRIDEVSGEPGHKVVEPVTISKESDVAISRENEIIKTIDYIKEQAEEVIAQSQAEPKSGIFPFILVIAAIIIILTLIYLSVFK